MCGLTKEEVSKGCKRAIEPENLTPKPTGNKAKLAVRRKLEDKKVQDELSHFVDSHLLEEF